MKTKFQGKIILKYVLQVQMIFFKSWSTLCYLGINSTSNVIEIAQGEADCYFNCFRILVLKCMSGCKVFMIKMINQMTIKGLVILIQYSILKPSYYQ